MEEDKIIADELRKNSRVLTDSSGNVVGSLEKYILEVTPQDVLATLRAVAYNELVEQVAVDNPPSQIIVDNLPAERRSIFSAKNSVRMRFQSSTNLLAAVMEAYNLLQRITRIQTPPKDSIVARKEFYLYIDMVNVGKMPAAVSKLQPGVIKQDSVVRIVGPLVPYGRKLFWNPIGTSKTITVRRYASKRSATGVRFYPDKGASVFAPRFVPYASATLRKKANRTSAPAETLKKMMQGDLPAGRLENAGRIVKRIMRANTTYRGLHISDGWIEYSPAIGWSKLRDPRVPTISIQAAKRGRIVGGFQ